MESRSSTVGAIQKNEFQVEIWASWTTLNYVKAEIVSLSEISTSLMFDESFVQHRDISSHPAVNLRIHLQSRDTPVSVRGRVQSLCSAKSFVTLTIEFINSQGIRVRLPEQVFTPFNRRATPRVILPSSDRSTIAIRNTTRNQEQTASLMDISEGGLRVLFHESDCPETGDRLVLEFTLPGIDYNFSLVARVLKQSCLASVKSCGVQFSTAGEDYKIQQLKIRQYVSGRLAELAEVALSHLTD